VEACANVIFVNNKNKTIKENKCFPSPCMDSFIDGTIPKSSVGDFTFYNEWDILQFVEMIFSRANAG
jgi:hypothetical protein